jgi:hypothetical protein
VGAGIRLLDVELRHTKIPQRFVDQLPEGLKYLHRHGKEYLVVEQLYCAQGHSLMSQSVRIHDEPSIRLKVRVGGAEGLIFVDAYWGSHDKLYGFVPPTAESGPMAQAFCPTCDASLLVEEPCEREGCGSKSCILFHLPGTTNRIYVCARLGCPWHRMDISHMPQGIQRSVSEINYFGHGEEEAFQGI